MKHPSRPPHELDPAGVLTPAQFRTGTDLWLSTRSAGGTELTSCLLAPGTTERLPAVYFPVMQVVELLSAVGVQSIRARFVVLRDEQHLRFTVALYAAGADNAVLSSYYLANRYWLLQTSPPPHAVPWAHATALKSGRNVPKNVVPRALASYWAANWADAKRYRTSAGLFTSNGQAMEGYNFAVSDFMDPLRGLNDFNNQLLAMTFGLHTFLHFDGTTDVPIASLGVMLRIANTTKNDADDEGDAFDVAIPMPPGH